MGWLKYSAQKKLNQIYIKYNVEFLTNLTFFLSKVSSEERCRIPPGLHDLCHDTRQPKHFRALLGSQLPPLIPLPLTYETNDKTLSPEELSSEPTDEHPIFSSKKNLFDIFDLINYIFEVRFFSVLPSGFIISP